MEVGRWDKKNNHRLHAILQPHYPGVHFLKNIEWSLSMAANHVFLRLMHFYTHLLHLLQPSLLWLSIVTFMMQSHRQSEFCANLMYREFDRLLEGSLHQSCKRDQIKIRDYMPPGGLPELSGSLPHQPGAPHLFVNRPLKIAFTLRFKLYS